jgi:galactitol-specific phosphotransferase system IIB component
VEEWLKENNLSQDVKIYQSKVSDEIGRVDDYDVILSTTLVPDKIKDKVIDGVPLLTGIFCSLAITGGWFEAVQILGQDNGTFWSGLRNSVDFWDDFGVAMLKSAIFGGTAALVASYVGFHAEPTIEGTSVATTRAVVNASLLVLMFNFVLSALLFQ